MSPLIPVLAGAVVTGIIGNALAQRWQLRSWFAQQRHLAHQQELGELKKLLDDLTTGADSRLHAMRSLARSLRLSREPEFHEALGEYRKQIASWNTNLNSLYLRLRLHYSYSTTLRLESEIHHNFVEVGRALEGAIRSRQNGEAARADALAAIEARMDRIQGTLMKFYEDLLTGLEARRWEIANGKRHEYRSGDLDAFTTLELIKALFVADVDGLYVIRPA
jgi:hypothetical protein